MLSQSGFFYAKNNNVGARHRTRSSLRRLLHALDFFDAAATKILLTRFRKVRRIKVLVELSSLGITQAIDPCGIVAMKTGDENKL